MRPLLEVRLLLENYGSFEPTMQVLFMKTKVSFPEWRQKCGPVEITTCCEIYLSQLCLSIFAHFFAQFVRQIPEKRRKTDVKTLAGNVLETII